MVRVCVRRNSDSQYSRAIYDAIKNICYQKQCPNEDRILRFVLREFEWKPADISKQLRFAVEDGLFREAIAISHKGSKKGNEQMSYRINTSIELDANGNSQTEVIYACNCVLYFYFKIQQLIYCKHISIHSFALSVFKLRYFASSKYVYNTTIRTYFGLRLSRHCT